MSFKNENEKTLAASSLACDQQRIEDYLTDRVSAEDQALFETHLSSCDACRQLLQERAAEPGVWENVSRLLGTAGGSIDEGPDQSQSDPSIAQQPGIAVLDSLAPTDDPEMLGRMGEYEISGVIGVGGMGAVLRGFDKSLRRVVAIKVMAPHLAGSGPARHRFQREARAAAAITHDNVIDIYGVAESNGLPYLVMPYARGPSLQKRIDQSGPMTAIEVIRIGRQIALGLAAAHEQGLVHRDIKPANILLTEGIERLWITDFGVARAMDDVSMTQTGLIAGTPQYMSPEQARGEFVDQRSDLFSMGSVLYTACTGRPPFRSEAAYGVLRRITDSDPTPIREINSDVPDWLCRIIERLMAKHSSDRYQSATEVADLFEGCLAHLQQPTKFNLPGCISSPAASSELRAANSAITLQPHRSTTRTKTVITMLALLLAAAVGVTAMQLTNPVDISGAWSGEQWKNVQLKPNADTAGWYSGSFTNQNGMKGAVHLEWSRMQRRFSGRWKLGEDMWGPITLRSARPGQITGAIAMDPESGSSPELTRLREFSWQRAVGNVDSNSAGTLKSAAKSNREVLIQSPVKAIVTKLPEGIANQSRVEKGQVIAVLQMPTDDPARQDHIAELERQAETQKLHYRAKQEELEAAIQATEAAQQRVIEYEKAEEFVERAGEKRIESIKSGFEVSQTKWEQEKLLLAAVKMQWDEIQKRLDDLQENELEKQEQLKAQADIMSNKLRVSEASVMEAFESLRAMETEIEFAIAAAEAQLQQAKTETSDVTADLLKTQAELAKAKTNLVDAQSIMDGTTKEIDRMKQQLAEVQRIRISAPIDGIISQLIDLSNGAQTIKTGDVICAIVPDPDPNQKAKPESPMKPAASTKPVGDAGPGVTLPGQTAPIQASPLGVPAIPLGIPANLKTIREIRRQLNETDDSISAAKKMSIDIQEDLEDLRSRTTKDTESDGKDAVGSDQIRLQAKATERKREVIEKQIATLNDNRLSLEEELEEMLASIRVAAEVLRNRHAVASKSKQAAEEIRDKMMAAFNAGQITRVELMSKEQSFFEKQAQAEELKIMLDYYNKALEQYSADRD